MSLEPFEAFLQEAILSLPEHLKGALRLVEDPDIPDEGRIEAAGALLHWLSGSNTIPGVPGGHLSLVDDVLILRLVYERLEQLAPEAMARHRESAPELYGELASELALTRKALGPAMQVLDRAVPRLAHAKHQGHTARECALDEDAATNLYEEVQSALVDLDLEPEEVGRALKGLAPLIESLATTLPG